LPGEVTLIKTCIGIKHVISKLTKIFKNNFNVL